MLGSIAGIGRADAQSGGTLHVVATLAELTALPLDALVDGQRMTVAGYHSAGSGGGVFRFSAHSTAATDGGIVFAPDQCCVRAPAVSLEYGHFGNPNGYRQLPHDNILWGSVSILFDNGRQTVGSKWLHGHSTARATAKGAGQ